jgi:hypothetical protein
MKKTTQFIIGMTLVAGSISPAFAQQDPFSIGVGRTVLTTEEKRSIQQWADNAQDILQKALYQATNRSSAEAIEIYGKAMISAVLAAANTSKTVNGQKVPVSPADLAAVIVLNQGLHLAYGLPSGKGGFNPPVLKEVMNPELRVSILNAMTRAAIDRLKKDVHAQENNLDRTPDFFELARMRIVQTDAWMDSVMNSRLELELGLNSMYHFLHIARHDALKASNFAAELLDVDKKISDIEYVLYTQKDATEKDYSAQLREVRGTLVYLNDVLAKKIQATKRK